MHTIPVRLVDIGYFLPEQVLDNETLVREFGDPAWTEEKIFQKTGIRLRHIASPAEFVSDLALKAVRDLAHRTPFEPGEIDFLILCTQTPDHALPATACRLQQEIGLPGRCMAFDFNQGCSGYVYGLGIASALIASGQARKGLLLTSEIYSRWIHPRDIANRTLFGDGASATLLEASTAEEAGLGPFIYGTDGKGYDRLIVERSGAHALGPQCLVHRPEYDVESRGPANLFMDGPEIFRFAVTTVPGLYRSLLDLAGMEQDAIDYVVFHQANAFMLNHLSKLMKLPSQKVVLELENTGNTVSSSIPLAIARAAENGRIADNTVLALLGFGVGYSWAGTLVRWRGGR